MNNSKFVIVVLVASNIYCANYLSIRGGISLSTISYDGETQTENYLRSNQYGVTYEMLLLKKINISTGISYLKRGVTAVLEEGVRDTYKVTNWSETFTYINIPIQIKYLHPLGRNNLFFSLGPSFDYLIKAEIKAEADYLDVTNETDKFDYGLLLNFGYEQYIFSNYLFIDYGYYYGLKSIGRDNLSNSISHIYSIGFKYFIF